MINNDQICRAWRRAALQAAAALLMTGAPCAAAEPEAALDPAPRFEEMAKIDVHMHLYADVPEFVDMLRRTNTSVVSVCRGGSQPAQRVRCQKRAEWFHEKYGTEFSFASTFDLTRRDEPGYARQATAWIDETVKAGAVMVKIWKDVGMQLKTPGGAYLMPDDPALDPIYAHLEKRRLPLMTHFADPIDAWRPLDPASVHYGYFIYNPEWHLYGKQGAPSHEDILAARDRVLAKHPDLIMIAAHLGSESIDLEKLAERLDRFPNLYADVSARTAVLQRQPAEKIREFFLRFQDRLLYGTDAYKYVGDRVLPRAERALIAASMEQCYRDDFDYYAGRGKRHAGGHEVEGLGLPREVLEKFYHRNARHLMAGIPAKALPKLAPLTQITGR